MDFGLNEETVMLRESAERFLREKCPPSLVKELAKGEIGYSTTLWKEMAELGWLGLIYDEDYGGNGGAFFDLPTLIRSAARRPYDPTYRTHDTGVRPVRTLHQDRKKWVPVPAGSFWMGSPPDEVARASDRRRPA